MLIKGGNPTIFAPFSNARTLEAGPCPVPRVSQGPGPRAHADPRSRHGEGAAVASGALTEGGLVSGYAYASFI